MTRKVIALTSIVLFATSILAATPVKHSASVTALECYTNTPPAMMDQYGRSCALSANSMLVGFHGAGHGGYRLYNQTPDGNWSIAETKAYSSGGDDFGRSVAITHHAMAIGGTDAVRVRVKNALGEWGDEVLIEAPAPDGGSFGRTVALDGSTLAIGADMENGWDGRVYVYTNDSANGWYLEETIDPPTDCDGFFGYALDIHNDILAIGAFEANSGVNDSGEVAVYQRVNGAWEYTAKMNSASTRALDAEFGRAVALSDRWLMIGDRGDVSGTSSAGRTHVFDLSKAGWPYVQTLNDSELQASAYFGAKIAVDGNLAVIASPDYDNAGNSREGRACLFFCDGSDWSFVRALPGPNAANSYFGGAVALCRNHVVCSAPELDDPESNAGAVYAYNVDQGSLKTSTTINDKMGGAVAISQNRLAVGIRGADWGEYSNAGKVNVYRRKGLDWILEESLFEANPQNVNGFGSALAMSGSTLLVGAPDANPDGYTDAGTITFFTRDGTEWARKTTIKGTDDSQLLGEVVAVDGTRAVASYMPTGPFVLYPNALISMVNTNGTFEKSGTVYPSGYINNIGYACSADIDGDLLVVGANLYNSDAGAVFFYQWSSANSKWENFAVKSDSAAGDKIGTAVAINGNYIAAGAPKADISKGYVKIYKKSGDSVSLVVKLTAPDKTSDDTFGYSLAFAKDESLLISAYKKHDGSNADAGAIYRFCKTGSGDSVTWEYDSVTYPPRKSGVATTYTYFGKDIDADGSTVAAGMYNFREEGANLAGAGVVYEITPRVAPADFDGDGITDIGCYFAPQGYWYVYKSATSALWVNNFGYAGTTPFVDDFDGDWLTDFGCFDPGSALWFFYGSTRGFWVNQFGNPGTERITGDFDGDGLADHGVFDPSIPKFFFMCSSDGYRDALFGTAGSEAVSGDFDGDGICDYGTYYAPSGLWEIHCSTDDDWETNFGYSGTTPVTGDFDGDGVMDFGCYYPPVGAWYFYESTAGFCVNNFGYEGTIPVTGDFDGDGVDDFGCYYPPQGTWYIYGSTDGFSVNNFGYEGTVPMY